MRYPLALLLAPMLLAGCLSHPPPPEAPYHAFGKESAWDLIIDDRNVTFIPTGGQPVVQPKPQVIIGIAGEVYQAGRIDVNIVHGSCQARDRTFADRVQVTVDGKPFEGCGGDFAVADGDDGDGFDETRWRVAAINGRPTPAGGEYMMSFANGDLGARFGCNHIGGRYSRSGNVLTATNIIATRMACAPPAGTFEDEGLRILGSPMRMDRSANNQLLLGNSNGSISLTSSD